MKFHYDHARAAGAPRHQIRCEEGGWQYRLVDWDGDFDWKPFTKEVALQLGYVVEEEALQYHFVLTTSEGTKDSIREVARAEGSPKVIAALLRAQAEEMDPTPEDAGHKIGRELGEDFVRNLLGGKR